MGWLDWLLLGAAALLGAVIISEVVSYFLDVPSIRQILIQKKASGKLPDAVKQVCVNSNDGHKVSMSTLINGQKKDTIELSSNDGVSNQVQPGMIINID